MPKKTRQPRRQLTSRQIMERLETLPLCSTPRSAFNISRATNIPCSTITAIERRALRRLRPHLERIAPTLYGEMKDMWHGRSRARAAPVHDSASDFELDQ